MGIPHLNYFMSQKLNGIFTIDMQQEIKAYKIKHNESPKIVVNFKAMIELLCPNHDKKGILSGGRYQMFARKFQDIFKKLNKSGAELIFFNEGPSGKFKNQHWCERQDRLYEETIKIFDKVYDGVTLKDIISECEIIPNLKGVTDVADPTNFGMFCKPKNGLSRNNVMATYATKKKAFAVLSDDTDFLIYEGNWKFWSINSINSDSMTTSEYNRDLLKKELQLDKDQMAILPTVAGNYFINIRDVSWFHRSLKTRGREHDNSKKFYNIAEYVKSFSKTISKTELISKLAGDIFSRDFQGNDKHERIEDSLSAYHINLQIDDDKLFIDYADREKNLKSTIMHEFAMPLGLSYVDLRKDDMPFFYEMVVKINMKEQGMLWKHQQHEQKMFQIISKRRHDQPYETMNVTPEYPEIDGVPDTEEKLKEFLFDPEHEHFDFELKLKVLIWILSCNELEAEKLHSLLVNDLETGYQYLHHALTLLFLVENEAITTGEADKILWTIKNALQNLIPEHLEIPEKLDGRAFRVSFLYSQMFTIFNRVLFCSGLSFYRTIINFDSVFFHINFDRTLVDLKELDLFRFYKN